MKSVSQFALPARAAERLFEIAAAMDAPHGFVDIGQLNYALLREGATPEEYRAGIKKLVADGLITVSECGTRLYFTDRGQGAVRIEASRVNAAASSASGLRRSIWFCRSHR